MGFLVGGMVLLIGFSGICSLLVSVAAVRSSQVSNTYKHAITSPGRIYSELGNFQASSLSAN